MFNNFIVTKIAKIREVLESTVVDTTQTSGSCTHIPPKLATFKVLTCQDVEKNIGRSLSKSGEADPIPTSLVKEALPLLIGIFNTNCQCNLVSSQSASR